VVEGAEKWQRAEVKGRDASGRERPLADRWIHTVAAAGGVLVWHVWQFPRTNTDAFARLVAMLLLLYGDRIVLTGTAADALFFAQAARAVLGAAPDITFATLVPLTAADARRARALAVEVARVG
jgi:hypothetical protein